MERIKSKKPKLCIFTLYDTRGASSRFRIFQYREKFEENYNTKIFPFWTNRYNDIYIKDKRRYKVSIAILYIARAALRIFQILFIASKSDLVIFQKSVIPKCPWDFLGLLKKAGAKVVFDVDDAIYLQRRDYSEKIVFKTDLTIVGNEELKKYYQKFSSNIIIIPTADDSRIYKKYINDTYDRKCIGWIGSIHTIDNLDLIVEAINQVIEKHSEVSFQFIADKPVGWDKKIKNATFIKWSEDYLESMKDFSIGIMPLKSNLYNMGKCGFKLIQYLNLQIPVLASDVGINANIVSNYGYICKTTRDWKEKIEKLLFDEESYKTCRENIKKTFLSRYGFDNSWNIMRRELSKLTLKS